MAIRKSKKNKVVEEAPVEVTPTPAPEAAQVDVLLVKDLIRGGERYKAGTVVSVKPLLAETLVQMGSATANTEVVEQAPPVEEAPVEEAPVEEPAAEETTDEESEV